MFSNLLSLTVLHHLRSINDPEHPLTLEELNVIDKNHITVDPEQMMIRVDFRPTIPHCSMATLIGLAIRVQLLRRLPPTFKVDVRILPGTHVSEVAINKQLDDKERVAAALENSHLLQVVNRNQEGGQDIRTPPLDPPLRRSSRDKESYGEADVERMA
ncbi:hypothetical protein HPB47_008368 [Ixodes persulcatus]|uniref:Uncharacterized protein n=1 Tax=Ixodes persulcatus TaxID=34615 RepID=A0AC60P4V2_IXOPE|nr:hypothetical protein HPB47_008368 [Ixodes persulcatus]